MEIQAGPGKHPAPSSQGWQGEALFGVRRLVFFFAFEEAGGVYD